MTIDLSHVNTKRELHALLRDELGFPTFYGMNWDAFWDAITGLVMMPEILTFSGWRAFSVKLPEESRMLQKIMQEYQRQFDGCTPLAVIYDA